MDPRKAMNLKHKKREENYTKFIIIKLLKTRNKEKVKNKQIKRLMKYKRTNDDSRLFIKNTVTHKNVDKHLKNAM